MKIDPVLLLAFAARLERADAALRAEIEAAMCAAGYDPAALRQVVAEADMAADDRRRTQAHLDAYRLALGLTAWGGFVERTIHETDQEPALA